MFEYRSFGYQPFGSVLIYTALTWPPNFSGRASNVTPLIYVYERSEGRSRSRIAVIQ